MSSGNLMAKARWIFTGPVSCNGGGGGTSHHPYTGATECFIPFGASMKSEPISLYTLLPADANLSGGRVQDDALIQWNNTCKYLARDCTTQPLAAITDTSVRVFVPTFLGFVKALTPSYKAGHHIDLRFGLGDQAMSPLAEDVVQELTSSCQVTAALAGLAPQCVPYDGMHNRLRTKLNTPKTLAAGDYALTIAVSGATVHTEKVAIRSK